LCFFLIIILGNYPMRVGITSISSVAGYFRLKELKMKDKIMKDRIQKEIDKVAKEMLKKDCSDKIYCELYAVRQALTWALDSDSAASPYDVILSKKISPLPH